MNSIITSCAISFAKNLSAFLHVLQNPLRKGESVRATLSRMLIILMLAQPILIHASPFVHGAEFMTKRSIAKLRLLTPKTVEAKSTESKTPANEKAIGIDEWLSENNKNTSTPLIENHPANKSNSTPTSGLRQEMDQLDSPANLIRYITSPEANLSNASVSLVQTGNILGYKSVRLSSDADLSASITPGDTIIFTLQYLNKSLSSSSFQINDLLPSGLTLTAPGAVTISTTGLGTAAAKNSSYTGVTTGSASNLLTTSSSNVLGNGGTITITIPVTVSAGAIGAKINQATATGSGITSGVLSDNVGLLTDLPLAYTLAPYFLTVPLGSVLQTTSAAFDPTSFTVSAPLATPDLKLLQVGPLSVQAGTAITYALTVTNIGLGATSGTTTILDALPPGVTVNGGAAGPVTIAGLQAGSWNCASDAAVPQTLTCTTSAVLAPLTGTSLFTFQADVAPSATDTLISQAKIFGGGDPDKSSALATGPLTACLPGTENLAGSLANAGCAYEATPVINVAGFKSVALTTDADTNTVISPGDTLTYTLTFVNTGSADATLFQLQDVLPAGLTKAGLPSISIFLGDSVAVSNPLYTGAAPGFLSNLLLAGALLKAGGVITLQLPVTVNPGFAGVLSNQASATAAEFPLVPVKTDNAGSLADLPSALALAPYNVTLPAGTIAQTTSAALDPVSVSVVNPPVVVAYQSVKLTLDADLSGSITPGDTVTYTLHYLNTGSVSVPDFQIADQLPAGLTLAAPGALVVAASGLGTAAAENLSYTGASLASSMLLAPGAVLAPQGVISVSIPVTLAPGLSGSVAAQATGSGSGMLASVLTENIGLLTDLPLAYTLAPYFLTVPLGSVLQTTSAAFDPTSFTVSAPLATVLAYKSAKLTTDLNNNTKADPGDTVTWSIWYKNIGLTDITTFQITDLLPAGVTITGTGNQTLNVIGSTIATTNPNYSGAVTGSASELLSTTTTFKAGDLIQIDVPVTVDAGFAGTLLNQAKGIGDNLPVGGVFTDNLDNLVAGLISGISVPAGSIEQIITPATDPTSLVVIGIPFLTLIKSVLPIGFQHPGTDLTYKTIYINLGNHPAHELVLLNELPNNTDFKVASETLNPGTTGLLLMPEFSNDFVAATPATATWVYVPVSGGGGADTGYDRNVKAVRWKATAGVLSHISPNHFGDVGFTVKIR